MVQVLSRRMQASEKTLYPRHDDEVGKLVGVGQRVRLQTGRPEGRWPERAPDQLAASRQVRLWRGMLCAVCAVLSLAVQGFRKLCP